MYLPFIIANITVKARKTKTKGSKPKHKALMRIWDFPGRFTFYAPHSSSNRIRCNDGFCFCFYGGYGAIETIAGFADEAVVDFDAHNRFTVNYLFLVDDDFLNQRVNQFLVQLRNIGIRGDQIGEILYALRFVVASVSNA